jgi:hypothetical protein
MSSTSPTSSSMMSSRNSTPVVPPITELAADHGRHQDVKYPYLRTGLAMDGS